MDAREINHSLSSRRDEQNRNQQQGVESLLFTDAVTIWQPILESQIACLKTMANGLQMFHALITELAQQQQGYHDTGQRPQEPAQRYGGQRS